jgi:hypothetical protein
VAKAVDAKPSKVAASTLESREPSPLNDAAVTGPENEPVAADRVPVAVMSWLTVSAPVMVPPVVAR